MLRTLLLLTIVLPLGACQLAAPVAIALPVVGSQTVLRGTRQMVEIRSEPEGATVTIAGYETRTTPTFIMLARDHTHCVRVSKEGFKTVSTDLVSQPSPGSGDSGWVGILDKASGAAFELNPARLTIKLEPQTPVVAAAAPPSAPILAPAPAAAPNPSAPVSTPTIIGAPPHGERQRAASVKEVLSDQLARLDRLLAQGAITESEHQILVAAAQAAAELAGITEAD